MLYGVWPDKIVVCPSRLWVAVNPCPEHVRTPVTNPQWRAVDALILPLECCHASVIPDPTSLSSTSMKKQLRLTWPYRDCFPNIPYVSRRPRKFIKINPYIRDRFWILLIFHLLLWHATGSTKRRTRMTFPKLLYYSIVRPLCNTMNTGDYKS